MSVKVMGQVWELDLPANEMLVLLAMTDHADHDGKNIYPGVPLVAWKTGYSEKQARIIIGQLVEKGLLYEDSANPGKRKMYHVDFTTAVKKIPRELGKAGRPSKNTPHQISPPLNNTPHLASLDENNTPHIVSRKLVVNHQEDNHQKDIASNDAVVTETDTTEKKKAPTAPRRANPIFKTVALHSFDIVDTAKINGNGGRIGKIVSWLNKNYPNIEPQDLEAFYVWYTRKHPNMSTPKDDGKFAEYYTAYIQQVMPVIFTDRLASNTYIAPPEHITPLEFELDEIEFLGSDEQ